MEPETFPMPPCGEMTNNAKMAGRVDRPVEDTVEYRLFPSLPEGHDEKDCKEYLEETLGTYLAHLSKLLVDYIWQDQPFCLTPVPTTTGVGPPHLWGKTTYGDNVEDEWFIVYILCQLTQTFPGLVAKVFDTDGEFLLIETANHLPKWLNPDTSENRVFLYRGKLHIVPQPQTPAQLTTLPSGMPSVGQALHCIREYPRLTLASDAIQRDLQRRLAGYPEKLHQFQHHAHCYLPAPLAAVLDKQPSLVAPMVQAFYLRDPLDLKSCVTMKYFRPGTRVTRQVKFTKCLYAQLMQQRFSPDKRGGWNIPASSSSKFKAYDLGMKLAHGAEILCARCSGDSDNENGPKKMHHDPRWEKFKSALKLKGYFKGEIEGSILHTKLSHDAKAYFYNSVNTDPEKGQDAGRQILTVLHSVNYDIEEMRKEEKDLPPPDDDSWLGLTPEQLDDMLNKTADYAPRPDSFDLSTMADSMKAFVENMSSHEGAEFTKGSEDGDVQFDPNSFIQTMQKMFEFEDSGSESSTDMSEYGSDDELGVGPGPSPQAPAQPVPLPRATKPVVPRGRPTPQWKAPVQRKEQGGDEGDDYLGMREYMKQMDKELSKTTIGESFEKQQSAPAKKARPARPPPPRPTGPICRPRTAPPPPPMRKTAPRATLDDDLSIDDEDDEDSDFEPVDVDLTAVKNLLESYRSQEGLAGPASNVLGSMGISLPRDGGTSKP